MVNAYFALWRDAIEAQGGTVEKFIGDAVMAVFGLLSLLRGRRPACGPRCPRHARRTARAERRRWPSGTAWRLGSTVGVDTGEVVVSTLGERAGHDFVAVGPTVNRASRLQSAAPGRRGADLGRHAPPDPRVVQLERAGPV